MKRLIAMVILFCLIAAGLSGCGNKNLLDTVYTYDRCVIELPNGKIVESKVDRRRDYEDGDRIQVEINGVYDLVHSSKIVLISN